MCYDSEALRLSYQEKEKAGPHATWENLDMSFQFEKKSVLRILVSSQQVHIGHCSIYRTKVLASKKGQKGYYTVSLFIITALHFHIICGVICRYLQSWKRRQERVRGRLSVYIICNSPVFK